MMLLVGSLAASSPSITAATTAGRVPASAPGALKTFMPTMSCGLTKVSQAAARLVVFARFVRPASTIVRTRVASGLNASVAAGWWMMTTREGGVRGMELEVPEGRGVSADALQAVSSSPRDRAQETRDRRRNVGIRNPGTAPEFLGSGSALVFCAFLDTSKRECYHQRRC